MFKLRTQLFAAILLVNVALAVGLYLFLGLSFEHSFTQYVSKRERALAETLANALETHYRSEGNWGRFRDEAAYWPTFLWENGRPRRRDFDRDFRRDKDDRDYDKKDRDKDNARSSSPNRNTYRNNRNGPIPLFLLDADKTLVAGMQWPHDQSYLRELNLNNQTIGFLGIPIRREMRDFVDQQFAQDLSKSLVVIIASTLLMALLFAVPLSHLLAGRISKLVAYVKELSQGHYKQALDLKGKDELNVLGDHLQNLGSTLAAAESQRNQWVSDISHELRTPVSVLQADLESMEDGVRRLDKSAISRLLSHTSRLKNLIEDLHNLSLSDAGSMRYQKEACDLTNIVQDSVGIMTPQFEKSEIALSFIDSDSESLTVLGDEQRLSQVILNLLQNSLNYTNAPGNVVVSLTKNDGNACLTINDSAPGVAKDLQPKLTERLFRVDSSRARNTGGAGLGLSVCANIIEAHNGTLTFSDSPLGGLSVTVSLPLHHEKQD